MSNNILLETGNGELEIVEFLVNQKHYCINVLKIKEIVQLQSITPIPGEKPEIAGKAVVRDMMVTVVDLNRMLEKKETPSYSNCLGLLCEFNQSIVVFLVDQILGIRRVKWTELEKPDYIGEETLVVANILIEGVILMLLDFEKILISLGTRDENAYFKRDNGIDFNEKRSKMKLVMADDSRTVRGLLKETLTAAGYTDLTFFNDGQEAYEYLDNIKSKLGESFGTKVNLMITDIEMPVMDGYTLTRKIKEDNVMSKLPIVVFSSLITNDLFHKGKNVGADIQISKPEIGQLVTTVDKLLGIS
ncbi:MAG: chemotaxis protein [Cellulosilyticaceae bacterium]